MLYKLVLWKEDTKFLVHQKFLNMYCYLKPVFQIFYKNFVQTHTNSYSYVPKKMVLNVGIDNYRNKKSK